MFTINDFFNTGIVFKYYYDNSLVITLSAVAVMIAAYLLGSINFAIIISGKKYHDDIRSHGSKNAGMTNMMRTYGRSAAAFTLIGDAAKAIVAGIIGYAVLGQLGAFIGGLFCMVGHVFPVFSGFKGGKGVVTGFAAVLMCDPFVFPILLVLFIVIVGFTKYISLGSIMCMMLYPILHHKAYHLLSLWSMGEQQTSPYVLFTVCIAAIIIAKHWTNIKRLLNGEESKFSFKKSVKTPDSENGEKKDK